jgi:hypothetical protein
MIEKRIMELIKAYEREYGNVEFNTFEKEIFKSAYRLGYIEAKMKYEKKNNSLE